MLAGLVKHWLISVKFFMRDIGQNALSQSDCRIFISFLQNKSMKQPHFLHVGKNSQKLKVAQKDFGWALSKYGCDQSGLWNLNWLCISRINRGNYLIFCMLVQNRTNWKVIGNFWCEHGKKWVWSVWWIGLQN